MSNVILDSYQINQKIKRLSYEIYENNLSEKSIILIGINKNGFVLSKKIKEYLLDLFPKKIELLNLKIQEKNPVFDNFNSKINKNQIKNKVIIVVDDVLNSGKTIAFSIGSILSYFPKKIEVAVLVDRSHKNFPVLAKYSGIKLNTTINEHVKIDLEDKILGYLI